MGAKTAKVVLIWVLIAAQAQAGCGTALGKVAAMGRLAVLGGVKGAGHVGKAAVYGPVVFPIKLVRSVVEAVRERRIRDALFAAPRILWRDKFHLLAYGLLVGLQLTTGNTFNQFEDATEGFDVYGGDGVRVIVDGFPDDDLLYAGAAETLYKKRYAGKNTGQKVVFVKVKTPKELRDALLRISKEHGRISHVEYFGHGFPGRLDMPDEYSGAGKIGHEILEGKAEEAAARQKEMDDAFLPGAKIRFASCFTMNNGTDRQQMIEFGTAVLGAKGGTVYGSKVQILPNWVEMGVVKLGLPEPPKWVRAWGDYVSAANGLVTVYCHAQVLNSFPHAEGPFHLKKTETVPIEPVTGNLEDLRTFGSVKALEGKWRVLYESEGKKYEALRDRLLEEQRQAAPEVLTRLREWAPEGTKLRLQEDGTILVLPPRTEQVPALKAKAQKGIANAKILYDEKNPWLFHLRLPVSPEIASLANQYYDRVFTLEKEVQAERTRLNRLKNEGSLPDDLIAANLGYLDGVRSNAFKADTMPLLFIRARAGVNDP